jgi:hypothetical protein
MQKDGKTYGKNDKIKNNKQKKKENEKAAARQQVPLLSRQGQAR